jgi:hypothetical protein
MKPIKCISFVILLISLQAVSQIAPPSSSYLKEAAISESGGAVHVVANSPRPLAQTLDALRKKYGWVVDYEDPRYLSKLDVVEASGQAKNVSGANLVPGGGSFSVDFPAGSPEQKPDEEKTLRLIVDAYNRSNNPGRFEVRKSSQGNFHVVGTATRDAKGEIAAQKAVFDSALTLLRRQKTAEETIEAICAKITRQRGIPVTLGVSPRKLLAYTPVTVGGTGVPARDLLVQTLTLIHGNVYWRLLFNPDTKGYYLDLHAIQPEKGTN